MVVTGDADADRISDLLGRRGVQVEERQGRRAEEFSSCRQEVAGETRGVSDGKPFDEEVPGAWIEDPGELVYDWRFGRIWGRTSVRR
jgi:hypothetical protein